MDQIIDLYRGPKGTMLYWVGVATRAVLAGQVEYLSAEKFLQQIVDRACWQPELGETEYVPGFVVKPGKGVER